MNKLSVGRGARAAALALAMLGLASCGSPKTMLTVNASAITRDAPNLAVVTLGVVARGATAREAQSAQSQRMQSVLQAARTAGAEDKDVQTVGFSLEPQFTYVKGQPSRISSYISRNMVAVRIAKLEAISTLIDATVAQGANELQGIQYTIQDGESARDAARTQALETARARGEAYAKAAKMKILRIRSITEPGGAFTPWDYRRDGYGSAVEQAAAAPVNPGRLDNRAEVTVVFELQ